MLLAPVTYSYNGKRCALQFLALIATALLNVAAELHTETCIDSEPSLGEQSAALMQIHALHNSDIFSGHHSSDVHQFKQDPPKGIHRVVGKDGVLMISVSRQRERFEHSRAKLQEAGIYPTLFEGTDGKDPSTPQPKLHSECPNNCALGSDTPHARSLQALIDSHRSALQTAQQRQQDWTAILEDDVVPVQGSNWAEGFDAAWAVLPQEARIVRLGRCVIKQWFQGGQDLQMNTVADGGVFRITKWTGQNGQYDVGGCTHAYMVHKSIIPELLGIFPCNCALDCCYKMKYFQKPGPNGTPRGLDILFNIDTKATPDDAIKEAGSLEGPGGFYCNVPQFGILKQDWRELPDGITKNIVVGLEMSNATGTALWNFPAFGGPPPDTHVNETMPFLFLKN